MSQLMSLGNVKPAGSVPKDAVGIESGIADIRADRWRQIEAVFERIDSIEIEAGA